MKADRDKITRLLKQPGADGRHLEMVEEDRYCVDISNQLLATGTISCAKLQQGSIIRAHMSHSRQGRI